MRTITVVAAVTIGLVLSPWLRATILRLSVAAGDPERRSCPDCAHRLLPAGSVGTLFPIAPTGRCPACHQRFGMPAAVMEVVSAGLLGALALRVHPILVLCAVGLMVEAGLVLGGIDANVRRLPNAIMVPTFLAVLALLLAAAIVDHQPHDLVRAVIGGTAAFSAYSLLAIVSSGLGFGDCKLAALLGLVLAWFGWNDLLAGVMFGFLFAALYLLPKLIAARNISSDRLAFGPFMLVGAVAVLLIAA